MIGNHTDAKAALESAMGSCANLYSDHGSARQVYLINGVIYKIERYKGSNLNEWSRYCSIAPEMLPTNIRIPEMALYRVGNEDIIAAEFVSGNEVGDCWEREDYGTCNCPPGVCLDANIAEGIRLYCNMVDLAFGNVINVDDIYYVVDLEC